MKIVFAGSDAFSVPALERLHVTWPVSLIMTAPAKPAGRGRALHATAVERYAREHRIPYITPASLGVESREVVQRYNPDLLVVVAYGRIFGPKFLALFPRGGINVHPSALPRFRGACPMVATLLAGERRCGVTVQQIALEVDRGAVVGRRDVPIGESTDIMQLGAECARVGAELLVETVTRMAGGGIDAAPQDERSASYCLKLTKQHGCIQWRHSAEYIARMVRAFAGWPGCYCYYKSRLLLIHRAEALAVSSCAVESAPAHTGYPHVNTDSCGSQGASPGTVRALDKRRGFLVQTGAGVLAIRTLQLGSRKATDWMSFSRGHPSFVGSNLGLENAAAPIQPH